MSKATTEILCVGSSIRLLLKVGVAQGAAGVAAGVTKKSIRVDFDPGGSYLLA